MSNGIQLCSVFMAFALVVTSAEARQWTDKTGQYTIEAELFAFDDENVVLQREDKELGMVRIEQLSEKDREYLKSKEAEQANKANIKTRQTWTTNSGLKLVGRVVDYVQREVTIQRRRSRMYVNDRVYENLPEIYQKLVRKMIEHFEGVEIPDSRALQTWLRSQRGQPRTFLVDGVLLELENGDEYAIPFFVFAEPDRRLLKAGWAQWRNVQDHHQQRDDHAFRLEAMAAAYARNRQADKQIAMMDLNLRAIEAGLTAAWEVTLYPMPGNPQPPRWVVVPGRNSAQATAAAVRSNPGFVAGSVRRVSR